jgi:orotate phosphoribosyltransferase
MMQDANVIGAFWSVSVALTCYFLLVLILKRYCSKIDVSFLQAATPYGEYMGGDRRGFTECLNVHTRAGMSGIFFDADNWLSDSSNMVHASSWIVKKVLEAQSEALKTGDVISGLAFVEKDSGPTGLISMQHLIANQTGMKTCTIRLRRWPFLPQAAIKGDPPSKDSKWLIISDVATTGGHIIKAAKVLENECWGATCLQAIVLLNRGGDTVVNAFKEHQIQLVSDDLIYGIFQQRADKKRENNSAI